MPRKTNLLLVSVGTILTSMAITGFILGYGVDTWLDTQPIFTLSFGCLGFVGGMLKSCKLLVGAHPKSESK